MDDEWRNADLGNGRVVPVRRGSPLDAAFPEGEVRRLPANSAMPWSLGLLGDMMWMRLPETRPFLAKLIESELEDAISAGRELMRPLLGCVVPDALWHPVMKPALKDFPRSRERLEEMCRVVLDAFQADPSDKDGVRYALVHYVLGWLDEPEYRVVIEEVNPELAELVVQKRFPSPPPPQ
jgi:hypothetical protein